jgi:hypothetical protein
MILPKGSIYVKQVTATDDLAFNVEDEGSPESETVLSSINIHCYTNDSYYGNVAFQAGILRANAVVWFDGVIRVADLRFKNYTAGSNCVIVITGIVR